MGVFVFSRVVLKLRRGRGVLELVVNLVHLGQVVQSHVRQVLPETHHLHLELLGTLLRQTLLVVECLLLRLLF
jgi:hypothetical protein